MDSPLSDDADQVAAEVAADEAPAIRDEAMAFFGSASPLQQAPEVGGRAYEERPQQAQMAGAICDALEAGEHLCVEAPTGIGKSFAYLIPAIHYAKRTRRPVVITTHTIALQEQLMQKDIPVLQKLLGVPFSAALAKGRENYLCLHRLEKLHDDQDAYLPGGGAMLPEVQRLYRWAEQTRDGSRADLPFTPGAQLWSAVCAEGGTCPREDAKDPDSTCFLARARRRMHKADVIVANHALFCVDLSVRRENPEGRGILPDYGAVIVDEAHTFEDVAAHHLGLRLSTWSVLNLRTRLYKTRNERVLHDQFEILGDEDALAAAAKRAAKDLERLFERDEAG